MLDQVFVAGIFLMLVGISTKISHSKLNSPAHWLPRVDLPTPLFTPGAGTHRGKF
jgi:hypothetical protein